MKCSKGDMRICATNCLDFLHTTTHVSFRVHMHVKLSAAVSSIDFDLVYLQSNVLFLFDFAPQFNYPCYMKG